MAPRTLLVAALLALALTLSASPAVAEDEPPGPPQPCFFFGWCLEDDPQEALQEFMGWLRDELTCTCPPL